MLVLPELSPESIDMIITDPPYSTPVMSGYGRNSYMKNYADLSIQEGFVRGLKTQFERVLKPNGSVFMFCDDKYYPSIFRAFYDWKTVQLIVWDKMQIGMGKPFRKRHELIVYANREAIDYNRSENITHYPTVLKYKPIPSTARLHPAQKPTDLLRDLIIGFTNPGDTVLDPFMGSGSTGEACKETGRNFIGIELNSDIYEIAQTRIGY
jgi:site-specific DNA-methyltransferase (adenine-specific)